MTQPWGRPAQVDRWGRGDAAREDDCLAVEEPLSIEVEGRVHAIVMRTPGDDLELATGLLLAEGVIDGPADVSAIAHCRSGATLDENRVLVRLADPGHYRPEEHARAAASASSCGLCGRQNIDALMRRLPPIPAGPRVAARRLSELPELLRAQQSGFERTGGLHAAALFPAEGRALVVREDVGRHNAVDKVVGAALRHDLLPLHRSILQVSGRVSFEIVQKALAAGVAVVSAVSAPTSLAVDLAREGGLALVGFVRDGGLNVYCGRERLDLES